MTTIDQITLLIEAYRAELGEDMSQAHDAEITAVRAQADAQHTTLMGQLEACRADGRIVTAARDSLRTQLDAMTTEAVAAEAVIDSQRTQLDQVRAQVRPFCSHGALFETRDTGRLTAEKAGGLDVAMVELNWRSMEPQRGVYNDTELLKVKTQVTAMRAAGFSVTLGLGLHYKPTWWAAAGGPVFINEAGTSSSAHDLVFSLVGRKWAEEFVTYALNLIGPGVFDAVRVTSGTRSELLYPEENGRHYWGFSQAAQFSCPVPGWKPSQVKAGNPRKYADWYVGALVETADWQAAVVQRAGHRGWIEVVMPGSGVRPWQYPTTTASTLPLDLLAVGPAWFKVVELLPANGTPWMLHCSSVADGSGSNIPPTDLDTTDPYAVAARSYSAARYMVLLGRWAGLPVSGENPGKGLPERADWADLGPTGMLTAFLAHTRFMRRGYWAHEKTGSDAGVLPELMRRVQLYRAELLAPVLP